MNGRPFRAAALLIIFAAHPGFLSAEEAAPEPPQVELKWDGYLKMQEDGDTVYWIASPSVRITRGELRIFADNLVIWSTKGGGAPTDPKFSLDEFYAEGHLRMESGEQVLEGEHAYVNFKNGTLLFTKARLHTRSKKRGLPLTLTAEEFRKVGQGDMVATDVDVSTCEFFVPDYKLNVMEVVIHENWRSGDIDLYGLTVEIQPLEFPIFWLPWIPVSFGSQLPLRKLSYQKSRRFGDTVRTKWGIDIPKARRDAAGNLQLDEAGEPDVDRWGFIGVDADWLELRGIGFGPEYDYQWPGYTGFGDVYFLNDRQNSPESAFSARLPEVRSDDRYRARFFHRQDLWGPLSADLELHKLSDATFREEFFEKEFKNEKAPETYGLLRFMQDNFGMTGLYRARINRFQDQVEYLPQITQSLITQPVWNGIYLSSHAQYANVRFQKDRNGPDANQERINRFDVHETAVRPFALGPVRFLPFATGRYSYFDYDRREEDFVSRWAAALGGRARVAAWKKFPVKSALLGLDGVRHIASAEIRYLSQWTSVRREELFQFDAVDQVDDFQEFAVEIRNRFEARNPATGEVYDALNIGIALEYYPEKRRDTKERIPQSILYPAYWINVSPAADGSYESRRASNIHLDLETTIRDIVTFAGAVAWNPYRDAIDQTEAELRFKPADNLTLRLSQQYVTGVTNTVGIGFEWKVSEKWTLGGHSNYDFRGERDIDHEYYIRRNLHDFDIEVGFKLDEGRDEVSATLSLIPHGKKERRLRGP